MGNAAAYQVRLTDTISVTRIGVRFPTDDGQFFNLLACVRGLM
jgi:hypothetical protein